VWQTRVSQKHQNSEWAELMSERRLTSVEKL